MTGFSVTERESEFTPAERDSLLASRRVENLRGRHGIPMDVATNPENRGQFEASATVDFAQAELDRIEAEYRDKYSHETGHGRFFTVALKDSAD